MQINKEKTIAALREIIETLIFVIVMVILIRFFIGEIRWIPSASMRPTLIEGDRIFVERFSRFFVAPKRGDIIVFYPPFEELNKSAWGTFSRLTGFFCKDMAYIKRVIGIPGDKLFIQNDSSGKYTVYINGKPLHETYILDDYDYVPCGGDVSCGPMTIPDGQYFMMGDNRGNSRDSRFWGYEPREKMIGKAVFLFWPLNRMKTF